MDENQRYRDTQIKLSGGVLNLLASLLNDMSKPTFLRDTMVGGKQPSAGALSLSDSSGQLDIAVPLQMLEKYPSNRTLHIAISDEVTGAVVASASRQLQDVPLERRSDGTSVINLSIGAPQPSGNYRLDGKLAAELPNEKEVWPSPVACIFALAVRGLTLSGGSCCSTLSRA